MENNNNKKPILRGNNILEIQYFSAKMAGKATNIPVTEMQSRNSVSGNDVMAFSFKTLKRVNKIRSKNEYEVRYRLKNYQRKNMGAGLGYNIVKEQVWGQITVIRSRKNKYGPR